MSRYILGFILSVGLASTSTIGAENCPQDGEVSFICGTTNPEDLYQIPDNPWIIAAGRYSAVEGPIYAVNSADFRVLEVYPEGALPPRHNSSLYPECSEAVTIFQPHGITLRERDNGVHELFVVGHGAREAIEVFDLDVRGDIPTLSWVGCIPAPDGTRRINSITALPDGYLGATDFDMSGGELWEWHSSRGWTPVSGSQMRGPNGLLSSDDGQWFYIGVFADSAVVRLSRGLTPVQIESVSLGFMVDNLRWSSDGSIVAAGIEPRCSGDTDCGRSVARVAKVDPNTMSVEQLVDYKGNEIFTQGTVAIEVGDEIWVGGVNGSLAIARFPQ